MIGFGQHARALTAGVAAVSRRKPGSQAHGVLSWLAARAAKGEHVRTKEIIAIWPHIGLSVFRAMKVRQFIKLAGRKPGQWTITAQGMAELKQLGPYDGRTFPKECLVNGGFPWEVEAPPASLAFKPEKSLIAGYAGLGFQVAHGPRFRLTTMGFQINKNLCAHPRDGLFQCTNPVCRQATRTCLWELSDGFEHVWIVECGGCHHQREVCDPEHIHGSEGLYLVKQGTEVVKAYHLCFGQSSALLNIDPKTGKGSPAEFPVEHVNLWRIEDAAYLKSLAPDVLAILQEKHVIPTWDDED